MVLWEISEATDSTGLGRRLVPCILAVLGRSSVRPIGGQPSLHFPCLLYTSKPRKADPNGIPHVQTLRVNRAELRELLSSARMNANSLVISLGGDLSWAESELPALQAVRQNPPTLGIRVFYDRRRIRRGMEPIFEKLHKINVELRPYPSYCLLYTSRCV